MSATEHKSNCPQRIARVIYAWYEWSQSHVQCAFCGCLIPRNLIPAEQDREAQLPPQSLGYPGGAGHPAAYPGGAA